MSDDDIPPISAATKIKESPYTLVILVSLLTGGGITTGINGFTNPRPDPWTGSDATIDREAGIARLTSESAARQVADDRIHKDLQRIETGLENCRSRLNTGQSREHETIQGIKDRLNWIEDKIGR